MMTYTYKSSKMKNTDLTPDTIMVKLKWLKDNVHLVKTNYNTTKKHNIYLLNSKIHIFNDFIIFL